MVIPTRSAQGPLPDTLPELVILIRAFWAKTKGVRVSPGRAEQTRGNRAETHYATLDELEVGEARTNDKDPETRWRVPSPRGRRRAVVRLQLLLRGLQLVLGQPAGRYNPVLCSKGRSRGASGAQSAQHQTSGHDRTVRGSGVRAPR